MQTLWFLGYKSKRGYVIETLLVKALEEELVAIDRREGLVWPGGFKVCFGIFDGILVLLLKRPKQNKHKNLFILAFILFC